MGPKSGTHNEPKAHILNPRQSTQDLQYHTQVHRQVFFLENQQMINIGKQPRWTAQCKSARQSGNQSLSVCGLTNLPISHKVQMWLISNPGQMWQRGEGESRSRPTLLLLLLHIRNSCACLKKEGKWLNLCCPLMTYWLYIIMEVNTLTRACEPAAISCSLVTFFFFFLHA